MSVLVNVSVMCACVCVCAPPTVGPEEMSIQDKFNLAKCDVHSAFFRDKAQRGLTGLV